MVGVNLVEVTGLHRTLLALAWLYIAVLKKRASAEVSCGLDKKQSKES